MFIRVFVRRVNLGRVNSVGFVSLNKFFGFGVVGMVFSCLEFDFGMIEVEEYFWGVWVDGGVWFWFGWFVC